ncbi:MAG: hypothetical protein JWQ35_7 [Bacteriovoracaceae bacterium]|nr:hypothetical protein [Bacteriovoracaceae bacterium]
MRIIFGLGFLISASACAPKSAMEHDSAELDRLMNQNQAQIDACYHRVKVSHPTLISGPLTIRADQNPDGSLSSIELIRGFPGSQPLYECIREEIASWKINSPLTRGPLEMTWKFK